MVMAMAQSREELRNRVAGETAVTLRGLERRLEQAGASRALLDQVDDLRRIAVAELTADQEARAAEIEGLAMARLEPAQYIRYAEQLLRLRYSPFSALHGVWGQVADEMNSVSHLPERSDWNGRNDSVRRFNRWQATAWRVIDQNYGYHGPVRP